MRVWGVSCLLLYQPSFSNIWDVVHLHLETTNFFMTLWQNFCIPLESSELNVVQKLTSEETEF